jgi:hypothetical protein
MIRDRIKNPEILLTSEPVRSLSAAEYKNLKNKMMQEPTTMKREAHLY